MPVMVLYKEKSISLDVTEAISKELADLTKADLDAAIEVRVVDVVQSHNANDIHIEMQFRDFKQWSDKRLEEYHAKVMSKIGDVLSAHDVKCAYSFYIIPSNPPRSIWAQNKTGEAK